MQNIESVKNMALRATTIDELLSPHFIPQKGEKALADRAALRLSEWCKASTSGDWSLFAQRLAKDQLSLDDVLARFASIGVANAELPPYEWVKDSEWILAALSNSDGGAIGPVDPAKSLPFEALFAKLSLLAYEEVKKAVSSKALAYFSQSAIADLNHALLKQVTDLTSPFLYSDFVKDLKSQMPDGKLLASDADTNKNLYDGFVSKMQSGGLIKHVESKPVLLRLLASVTRQWINTTIELIDRVSQDLPRIQEKILGSPSSIQVGEVGGDLSDPHNLGHAVQIIGFTDGSKVLYKPKDLRLDAAWVNLVDYLNSQNPAIKLRAVKTIACNGYGWTEFVEHSSCKSEEGFKEFYERSGAYLILFHLLSSSDMHFENIIASGSDPVPIDLEMILQASNPEQEADDLTMEATNAAIRKIQDSVLMVGMLPSYSRSPKNKIFDAGGLNASNGSTITYEWKNINTNGMRWVQVQRISDTSPNVPHVDHHYAKFGDYIPEFIDGFKAYATFLLAQKSQPRLQELLNEFAGLPVRKVIRPTRFYYMLLQRLKDYRTMNDGINWSAQSDFLARLGDWDAQSDLLWPLQVGERFALANLNVPHFTCLSDGNVVSDIFGNHIFTPAQTGLSRAKDRWANLSQEEIEWQSRVIQISTSFVAKTDKAAAIGGKHSFDRKLNLAGKPMLSEEQIAPELKHIAKTIMNYAYIKDQSAGWIGLDWLAGSDVGQLVPLGPDLYNGVGGIALFLAAYAKQFQDDNAKELALKALASLRQQIYAPTAARWARSLGIGGASGLGSVLYALTNISVLLDDPTLLEDAMQVSRLYTDELIDADQTLDVIAGSAGGILSLLALYRLTQSKEVLAKAIRCGEHLLKTPRVGEEGRRSWVGLGLGDTILNGISHGAAGFELALSSLAIASGRQDFMDAAKECYAFEAANYDSEEHNWPDLRDDEDGKPMKAWVCQWCHGAPGIGLSRIGGVKFGADLNPVAEDIKNAAVCVKDNWPNRVDTLCCGTMGSIEFLNEAGKLLSDQNITSLANQRLVEIFATRQENGDYSWPVGGTEFNLGLFRGASGVGYTLLRRLNPTLPNILIWE